MAIEVGHGGSTARVARNPEKDSQAVLRNLLVRSGRGKGGGLELRQQ